MASKLGITEAVYHSVYLLTFLAIWTILLTEGFVVRKIIGSEDAVDFVSENLT